MPVDMLEEEKKDDDEMADLGAFRRTFVANVKNLIEFQDQSGNNVTRERRDIMNDIVLYI